MIVKNSIQLWGDFRMTVFENASGSPVKVYSVQRKNQITTEGQTNLLKLFGDPAYAATGKNLGKLIIGQNGQSPAPTNTRASFTAIWQSLAFESGTTVTVDSGVIEVNVTIPAGETALVGQTIREAGITTADNFVLYARQKFTDLTVGPTMSITINWQLGMTLQS